MVDQVSLHDRDRHSSATPSSSAMMAAAFSPINEAVEYVFYSITVSNLEVDHHVVQKSVTHVSNVCRADGHVLEVPG